MADKIRVMSLFEFIGAFVLAAHCNRLGNTGPIHDFAARFGGQSIIRFHADVIVDDPHLAVAEEELNADPMGAGHGVGIRDDVVVGQVRPAMA